MPVRPGGLGARGDAGFHGWSRGARRSWWESGTIGAELPVGGDERVTGTVRITGAPTPPEWPQWTDGAPARGCLFLRVEVRRKPSGRMVALSGPVMVGP
ncbi:hypothetical protein [Amycolatopsis arida]|uniref:hypothetical protein n=1 Tax=Amycolatopsis arida TaxID=587909 RepID=UPI000B81295F|nr:hypothetical protein [Amycolatopsis arida]